MPYLLFKARGAGVSTDTPHPFKIIIEQAVSGIGGAEFGGKAPCDTGDTAYLSSFQYKDLDSYPTVRKNGDISFKIHTGSKLYNGPGLYDETPNASGIITSYQGDRNESIVVNDCSGIYKEPVLTVYGLNRNVFFKDFFPPNPPPSQTLKIWLGVAFPVGDPNPEFTNSMTAFELYATGDCSDCLKRANTPMTAFIGCSTGDWPKSVEAQVINKSTSTDKPRYERRQLLARVPIGEIDASGSVKQYCDSNLTLTDMCIQGIPAKYPLSIFCNYR